MLKSAVLLIFVLLVSSCQSNNTVCTAERGTPQHIANMAQIPMWTAAPGSALTPALVTVSGKQVIVDKLVQGPLCNDTWRGVVYVDCDVQIAAWEENPTFLRDCDLEIAPGTVVYVAAHNDAAYYKGCSCHDAEEIGQE
jgi:hypothetical protein